MGSTPRNSGQKSNTLGVCLTLELVAVLAVLVLLMARHLSGGVSA